MVVVTSDVLNLENSTSSFVASAKLTRLNFQMQGQTPE